MAPGPRLWAKLEASSLVQGLRTRLNTTSLFVRGIRARVDGSAPPFVKDVSRYLLVCLGWIPVAIFIQDHVFELVRIRGPSMSPFFNERYNETRWGDVCFARKLHAQENLDRGMIVTFR